MEKFGDIVRSARSLHWEIEKSKKNLDEHLERKARLPFPAKVMSEEWMNTNQDWVENTKQLQKDHAALVEKLEKYHLDIKKHFLLLPAAIRDRTIEVNTTNYSTMLSVTLVPNNGGDDRSSDNPLDYELVIN